MHHIPANMRDYFSPSGYSSTIGPTEDPVWRCVSFCEANLDHTTHRLEKVSPHFAEAYGCAAAVIFKGLCLAASIIDVIRTLGGESPLSRERRKRSFIMAATARLWIHRSDDPNDPDQFTVCYSESLSPIDAIAVSETFTTPDEAEEFLRDFKKRLGIPITEK